MNALDIEQIRADDRCQPRATFDTQLVEQYAEAMANGDVFPPIKVFFDGADYFLADGFHRYHAAKSLGLADIAVDVTEGTLRDAILFSCSANAAHGWRRTNDDKRRAVLRLLNDPEWQNWSDREIARRCAVSPQTVVNLRPKASVQNGQIERTVQRNGTIYTQNTANIGTRPSLADQIREQVRHDLELPEEQRRTREEIRDEIVAGGIGTQPKSSPVEQATWRDSVNEEVAAKFDEVNRETWSGNIKEIVRLLEATPSPAEAARRFPTLLLHTIDPLEMECVADWFTCFSEEIRNRKESANVAAQ